MTDWQRTGVFKIGHKGLGTKEDPMVPWVFAQIVQSVSDNIDLYSWDPVGPAAGWEYYAQRSEKDE